MWKVPLSNGKCELKKEAVTDSFDNSMVLEENPENEVIDVKPFIFCDISKKENLENDEITEIKPSITYDECKESCKNELVNDMSDCSREVLEEDINKSDWVAGTSTVLCEVRPIGILTTLLPNCTSHSFQTTNLSSDSQHHSRGSHTSNAVVIGFQDPNKVKYCFIKSEDIINADYHYTPTLPSQKKNLEVSPISSNIYCKSCHKLFLENQQLKQRMARLEKLFDTNEKSRISLKKQVQHLKYENKKFKKNVPS